MIIPYRYPELINIFVFERSFQSDDDSIDVSSYIYTNHLKRHIFVKR